MRYKEYGKTGKSVSVIGFGGMRFDTTKSIEENAGLVKYAHSRGINYFDTAPGYCSSMSEKIFGKAFSGMGKDFYVSTKEMPGKADTAQKARDAVKSSIDKLKVDKINFYHVWCIRNIEHYRLAMKPGGQYEGLLRCKEEGLIDHIVFSSHQQGSEVKRILDENKFDGVLLGVNILNYPYRWEGISYAFDKGYGVVAMNPLGGGLIPRNEDRLRFLSIDGLTPVESALRFIVSCPEITVALNGFTEKAHVDTAVKVAEMEPVSVIELNKFRNKFRDNMNSACTACGYCWECPHDIPVPAYMQHYNSREVFGAADDALMRELANSSVWGTLSTSKGRAGDCIQCGACEEACTQHLPVIERLAYIAELEKQIRQNRQ